MSISKVSGGSQAAPPAAAPAVEASPRPATDIRVPKADLVPIPKAEVKVDVERLKAQLQAAIAKMNDAVKDGGRGLSFSMDSAVGVPVVVVKNVSTGEVIRQIPNAEAVKTAHNIERFRSVFINKLV